MNSVLLIVIIFNLALVCWWRRVFNGNSTSWSDFAPPHYGGPCENSSRRNKYEEFVKRHILQEDFDRNSLDEWARYLAARGLSGRTRVQSFIEATEAEVQRICSKSGRRLTAAPQTAHNLCISRSTMVIYDVISSNFNITRVQNFLRRVIVACNKVGQHCLPVHFEPYRNQMPDETPCVHA